MTDAEIEAIAQGVAARLEGALRSEVNELKQAIATFYQWRTDFIAHDEERHQGLAKQESQVDTLWDERQYHRGIMTTSLKVATFIWAIVIAAAAIVIANAGAILDNLRHWLAGP